MADAHSTEILAPALRAPELTSDNNRRALRFALWLALDAADRCGDSETSDTLLFLYQRVMQAVR